MADCLKDTIDDVIKYSTKTLNRILNDSDRQDGFYSNDVHTVKECLDCLIKAQDLRRHIVDKNS